MERTGTRILLIGNHTCGNRGDGAILRGLIAALEEAAPDAEITVTSRMPVSSSYLLGRPVIADFMADWFRGTRFGGNRKGFNRLRNRLMPRFLGFATNSKRQWMRRFLPQAILEQVSRIEKYDFVIQVGGSFFLDLYGLRQFETPFATFLAGRPLVLLGHSMGPFENRASWRLAELLLSKSLLVSLREPVSRDLLIESGLPMDKVKAGSDTAWLVPASPAPPSTRARFEALTNGRPAVAITLRDLYPFDRRLGIEQADYERGFATLADELIEQGYDVVVLSTCTGIDSYWRDDRMQGLKVQAMVRERAHCHVIIDELNDVELGHWLSLCKLVIATRLHSAIIAMNFGTVAIALNYEHKSEGILAQLGVPELAMKVGAIVDGSAGQMASHVLENLDAFEARVAEAVGKERLDARAMVHQALDIYRQSR